MKKLVLVSAVIGSLRAVAHADERPTERSEVSATVGFATPVGEAGVEGVFVPTPYLEVGLGVGFSNLIFNRGNGAQPQLAVMPRLRLPVGRVRFTLGAGVSGGTYSDAAPVFSGDPYLVKANALWLNGEVGAQYMRADGVFVAAYVGFGKIVAHSTIKNPAGTVEMAIPDDSFPFVGIKSGYTF